MKNTKKCELIKNMKKVLKLLKNKTIKILIIIKII